MAHHTKPECEGLGAKWNEAAQCCIGYDTCTAESTTPATPPSTTTSTPPATTPATPPSTPLTFDMAGLSTQLTDLVNSFFGFFKQLDGPKFFIILGLFLFGIAAFWGKKNLGGLPTPLFLMLGLVLTLYGGMQKYGIALPGLNLPGLGSGNTNQNTQQPQQQGGGEEGGDSDPNNAPL
jgi:hypothetical protein